MVSQIDKILDEFREKAVCVEVTNGEMELIRLLMRKLSNGESRRFGKDVCVKWRNWIVILYGNKADCVLIEDGKLYVVPLVYGVQELKEKLIDYALEVIKG